MANLYNSEFYTRNTESITCGKMLRLSLNGVKIACGKEWWPVFQQSSNPLAYSQSYRGKWILCKSCHDKDIVDSLLSKYMDLEVDDLTDGGRNQYFKMIYGLMTTSVRLKDLPYEHGLSTNVQWLQFVDEQLLLPPPFPK